MKKSSNENKEHKFKMVKLQSEISKGNFASKFALPASIIAVSFAAIFVRFSEAHPISISFHRMLFSTLILSLLVPYYYDEIRDITRKKWIVLISAGFFLAAHMATWVASLDYTSVASSVVLVTSHPLLVAWLSSKYLEEKTTVRSYIGIIIALTGIAIMMISDFSYSKWSLVGDLLAIFAMFMAAGYIIRGRQIRQKMSVIPYAFVVYGFSTIFLAIFSLPFSTSFQIYSINEYIIFLALAIVPTMFGHTVYNWSLKYVKARVASVSLLGEPIGASILAFLILQEVPPTITVAGAIITLIGIYFCQRYD